MVTQKKIKKKLVSKKMGNKKIVEKGGDGGMGTCPCLRGQWVGW